MIQIRHKSFINLSQNEYAQTYAAQVLLTENPIEKARLSIDLGQAWIESRPRTLSHQAYPSEPRTSEKPILLPPGKMKKRSLFTPHGRQSLLHALAHIELNAINLAWDMVGRFAHVNLPKAFYDEWIQVGIEEGRHFLYLNQRLSQLGLQYGDLPAHGGLWETANRTKDNLLARLAVIPLVLEARGLDVTPKMIEEMGAQGDHVSAAILKTIYEDEITHVATGKKWFDYLCAQDGLDPIPTYHACVRTYFKGKLVRPFNKDGRDQAGLSAAFYEPLAEDIQ